LEVISIDLEAAVVQVCIPGKLTCEYPLASPEAFRIVSKAWLRAGWDTKYVYSFSWLGRPIIQLPDDLIRLQEVIYRIQPDVIIETGVAHGGSLVFYASLCKVLDRGRVVGVDVEMRPHNRKAIETHPLSRYITLVEGNSIDDAVLAQVRSLIRQGDKVLVVLDSCHTKEHVLQELMAYGPFVARDSYIVACDGIMEDVAGGPRTQPDWNWNNPKQAVFEFLRNDPAFILEEPPFLFNEGLVRDRVTYWPSAYLKRVA
jgi:cephalosporin hydroxylase